MDADGVPLVGQSLDLKLLEPLQHKRTLAYINHFIIQMTGHLNRFACQAESKLAEVDRRTQQIQTTLLLLEAKLASIPELEGVKLEEAVSKDNNTAVPVEQTVQSAPVVPADKIEEENEQPAATAAAASEPAPEYTPVSKDPRYAKYFKMVHMGIPPAALHSKMRMEGLDPIYLDNPDQPAPPNSGEVAADTDSDSDGSSYDSD
ncbi:WASH complex subunit 3-like [Bolinopsis microptera]|uniref:WASH complex subunit 3-like n=1 Tax=Bolinopsis microptera TaxID=2820187 RepID=UPI003079B8E8